MANDQNQAGSFQKVSIWYKLFAIFIFLCCLPVLPQTVGAQFLPSLDWISKAQNAGITTGIIGSCVICWLVARSPLKSGDTEFKRGVFVVVSPFFGYILTKTFVVILLPWSLALFMSHQIELVYTVQNSTDFGTRACRSPVKFQGLPLLFDSICHVSPEMREKLKPNTKVTISGWGTSYGIFADDFHLSQ